MLSVCPTEIVYRHELSRPPTNYEMSHALGFDEFVDALKANGWCDFKETATKTYRIEHSPGDTYIEWCATILA